MIPGEIRAAAGEHELNAGRKKQQLAITNDGDRPIQVGSHCHLPDANGALNFDREAAQGYRLDIAPGKSERFEPGASRTVHLVELGGNKLVPGLQIKETDHGQD